MFQLIDNANRPQGFFGYEVHDTECTHAKKILADTRIHGTDAGKFPKGGTPQEIFDDLNADFIAEGDDGYPVTFYPCTGMVEKVETIED